MYYGLIGPIEIQFMIGLVLSIGIGFVIGAEREMRGKDAGISTHILVIAGSMLFTLMSVVVDDESRTRIAAQIVTGIGFLGAGLILKEGGSVKNLTTAASMWLAAAIGMSLGFGFYIIALIAGVAGVLVPRIHHIHTERSKKSAL